MALKIQALVVADDPALLEWLRQAAHGAEFSLAATEDIEELTSRIDNAGRIDVVFFEFNGQNRDARAVMVERLLERFPELPVAGLGEDGDSSLMLAAMRAGARDFFVLRRDDENLAALLGRLLRRATPSASAMGRKQGKIFGVMSAVPTDAIAFLAEHLALACAENLGTQTRVLLIDIAIPEGAVNVFLNMSQTYGILDAINDGARCDTTLVDTAFPRHAESGLYVLSLPEDLVGRPHVDDEELAQLLSVLRTLFGCIVIGYDGHLPRQVIRSIIGLSDRSLLITDQSILKSRHNKHLLRSLRLEDCPLDRAGLVIDNYRRRVGLEPANLSELLELPVTATLTSQSGHRVQAMNQGVPMFSSAPKDEYCTGVRALATDLLGLPSSAGGTDAGGGGLLGRLFK